MAHFWGPSYAGTALPIAGEINGSIAEPRHEMHTVMSRTSSICSIRLAAVKYPEVLYWPQPGL